MIQYDEVWQICQLYDQKIGKCFSGEWTGDCLAHIDMFYHVLSTIITKYIYNSGPGILNIVLFSLILMDCLSML